MHYCIKQPSLKFSNKSDCNKAATALYYSGKHKTVEISTGKQHQGTYVQIHHHGNGKDLQH